MLTIRRQLDSSGLPSVLQIPILVGLRGKVATPEAQARLAFEEAALAVAPARPQVIR